MHQVHLHMNQTLCDDRKLMSKSMDRNHSLVDQLLFHRHRLRNMLHVQIRTLHTLKMRITYSSSIYIFEYAPHLYVRCWFDFSHLLFAVVVITLCHSFTSSAKFSIDGTVSHIRTAHARLQLARILAELSSTRQLIFHNLLHNNFTAKVFVGRGVIWGMEVG